MRIGTQCAVLLFTIQSVILSASPVEVLDKELIVTIDLASYAGTTVLPMKNNSNDTVDVLLRAGTFVTTTGRRVLSKVTFTPKDSPKKEPLLEVTIPPHQIGYANIAISDFRIAGEASCTIYNDTVPLATVKALNFDVPFSVSIEPEITIQKNAASTLVFKNEDPMTYPVTWSLFLPDNKSPVSGSTITLPAKSTLPVRLPSLNNTIPPVYKRLFSDYSIPAKVKIQFSPKESVAFDAMPARTITIQAKYTKFMGDFSILIVILLPILFAGSFCSLFLYLFIPNKQSKIKLLQSLEELSIKTRCISTRINPSLRVDVRVRRIRLYEQIKPLICLLPVPAGLFDEYKSSITQLEKRITMITELDRITNTLENYQARSADAPATHLDTVVKGVQGVTDILKLQSVDEKDYLTAQQTIQNMQKVLSTLNEENAAFTEKLSGWVTELAADFDINTGSIGKIPKSNEVRLKLKEIFDVFSDPKYTDKSMIVPAHYHWLSSCIERLFVLRHFIRAWEYAANDSNKLNRLKKHEEQFLELLRLRTWNSLQEARCMRREIEEDIYSEDIEKALADEAFSLSTTPILPSANQPVQLEIHFNNKKFTSSTAINRVTCIWDFGFIGKETGWNIVHYFRNPEESTYAVSFLKPDGEMIKKSGTGESLLRTSMIQLQPHAKKWSNEVVAIEIIKFSISFFTAVFGLIAGAREQLLKLGPMSGILAVFILGFSADTVKNLITRPVTNK